MAWCKAQFSNIILYLSFIMCKRYIRSQAHPNCLFLPEWYFYFYEIPTTFNKLKIMSEVVLLSFLFWLLCCLSFTEYDYPFCPFSFDYCVVSPSRSMITPFVLSLLTIVLSLLHGVWLPMWYLQTLLAYDIWTHILSGNLFSSWIKLKYMSLDVLNNNQSVLSIVMLDFMCCFF